MYSLSRAEEITSEVRKLVMACRTMEAQLQQSISKKAHQEAIAKMQATIDGLNAEIEKTKAELQNTQSVGDRVNSLSAHVSSQVETINSLSSTITAQREIIESLSSTISKNTESLAEKLSRETVPVLLYNETLSRIGEMEERIRFMVERADYVAVQKRCDELTEKLSTMVPTTEYLALQSQFSNYVPKEQFEEAQRNLANSVPSARYIEREAQIADLEAKLAASVPREVYEGVEARAREYEAKLSISIPTEEYRKLEAHVSELESRLAASVPRADYEELTGRIASIAKEASIFDSVPRYEATKPEPVVATEIREVQTQLSEIKSAAETGATNMVDSSLAFNFTAAGLTARSGLEFLTDIEKAPIEVIETYAKSGDFERWFKDVLHDESSSVSLRQIREGNYAGEELRTKLVAVIAPRYRA